MTSMDLCGALPTIFGNSLKSDRPPKFGSWDIQKYISVLLENPQLKVFHYLKNIQLYTSLMKFWWVVWILSQNDHKIYPTQLEHIQQSNNYIRAQSYLCFFSWYHWYHTLSVRPTVRTSTSPIRVFLWPFWVGFHLFARNTSNHYLLIHKHIWSTW